MIIKHEGIRLKVYTDTKGIPTIGVGRNLRDRGISNEEALYLLQNDLRACLIQLQTLPFWGALNNTRQRVLVDMCFNLGYNGLMNFKKTLQYIKDGEYGKASLEMLNSKWAKEVGNRATELSDMMRKGE